MLDKGHDFFISARNKEVSHTLLDKYSIAYFDRGQGASDISGKFSYLIKTDRILYKKAKYFKPDLFLSFASPYLAHISKLLRKPHISFTDTEKARLGIISFAPFTDCILTPASFRSDFGGKHIRFNGFMELCYLYPGYFKADINIPGELNIKKDEQFALLRFVSWGASHDIGESGINDKNKIILVRELSKRMRVLISAEKRLPPEIESFRIRISPEKIHDVLSFASICISEGATMASECAMLGTPVVYINTLSAGTLKAQEEYGLLYGFRNLKDANPKIDEIISQPDIKFRFEQKRKKMLSEQIDVTRFMVWFVENYPESFRIMKEDPEYQKRFGGLGTGD